MSVRVSAEMRVSGRFLRTSGRKSERCELALPEDHVPHLANKIHERVSILARAQRK